MLSSIIERKFFMKYLFGFWIYEYEFTCKNKINAIIFLVFALAIMGTNRDAVISKFFIDKKLIPACYYCGNIIV